MTTLGRVWSVPHPTLADEFVRETLAEAIQALAGTGPGREALVRMKVHEHLRAAYGDEPSASVCGVMEHTMDLLLRDGEVRERIQEHAEGKMVMGE